MKSEIEKIKFTIEKIKFTAKERKIAQGWQIGFDEKGNFRLWYEEPVLPDELFEI